MDDDEDALVEDEQGLAKYLEKMRPKCSKAVEKMNARGSRISVTETAEGELLKIEKSSFLGKPLHLLISGNSFRIWRNKPDKIVYESNTLDDLMITHQIARFVEPYGLGQVGIVGNKKSTPDITGGRDYLNILYDVNVNDVLKAVEFRKKHRIRGFQGLVYPDSFLKYINPWYGRSAVYSMAGHWKLDGVKQCLECGFDEIDAGVPTPLQEACSGYNGSREADEVIYFLLENGADPNADYDKEDPFQPGKSPLHIIVDSWSDDFNTDIIRFFLEKGADPNHRACDDFCCGNTPLMLAVMQSVSLPLIKILLEYGGNPNIVNKEGKSALDYAKENGIKVLIDLLSSV